MRKNKELTETREAEKSSKRQKQQESAAKQQTLESIIEKSHGYDSKYMYIIY